MSRPTRPGPTIGRPGHGHRPWAARLPVSHPEDPWRVSRPRRRPRHGRTRAFPTPRGRRPGRLLLPPRPAVTGPSPMTCGPASATTSAACGSTPTRTPLRLRPYTRLEPSPSDPTSRSLVTTTSPRRRPADTSSLTSWPTCCSRASAATCSTRRSGAADRADPGYGWRTASGWTSSSGPSDPVEGVPPRHGAAVIQRVCTCSAADVVYPVRVDLGTPATPPPDRSRTMAQISAMAGDASGRTAGLTRYRGDVRCARSVR